MEKPDPCPCCGNTNLYVGPEGDSMGIQCTRGVEDDIVRWMVRLKEMPVDEALKLEGCGLKLFVPLPDDYPDDFPEDLVGMDAVNKLREMTLEVAIHRWNQRFTPDAEA